MMLVIHSIEDIDFSHGGPSRSVPNLCIGLKDVGIDCEVLTYHSGNPNDKKLNEKNISIRFLPIEKGLVKRLLRKNFVLPNGISQETVVHIQHIWSLSMHRIAHDCRKKKIPYLISPRGSLTEWAMNEKRWKKRLGMAIYQMNDLQQASCIHVTAEAELDDVRRLGLDNPVAIIPNGINIDNYPQKEYGKKEKTERVLLFLSRIHPKKGLPMLLQAWKELPQDMTEGWRIDIVGEGDTNYSLDDFKKEVALYPEVPVNIVGPKYGVDKIDCYHNADLFILPSYSENFGMVIAEALCCGLPVITTTGTPWKMIEENGCGWWVEPTIDGIKKGLMDSLSLSNSELESMGIKGRQMVVDSFSIASVAKKFKQLYQWILAGGEKPEFVYG